ncbi:MAG: tRNA lysidine(34) synthetase TilS [bacterium]
MLEKRLIEKIVNSGLIKHSDKIVVGLSGGPDSIALIILLNKLKNKYNLSLFPAHINYHLRGSDSDKDEKFCKDLTNKLRLPFSLHSADKNTLKKSDNSIQNGARKIRLKYFTKIAQKYKANKIAMAHQADDQAETILMKFLRGSGKHGLSGISGNRPLTSEIQLIHPLLSISRKQILNFLKKEKVSFREDSSNKKTVYMRNKIRLKLIPFLEKNYQPQIKERLNDMAKIWALENEYLENISKKTAEKLILQETTGKFLSINSKKLLKTHPVVQARILQFYSRKFTFGYNINFGHIAAIQKILRNKKAKINLPQKLIVEKIDEKLLFYCNN